MVSFFFSMYFFNWRIIALQCFVAFCHTTMRISRDYIYIREGNGTPLQYSCLENPMDGGAW